MISIRFYYGMWEVWLDMSATLIIIGYLLIGFCTTCSIPKRLEQNSNLLFSVGLFLWPLALLFYCFFVLVQLRDNIRRKLKLDEEPTPPTL